MKGVHAAIVTPFDRELNVDHDSLAAQIERLLAGGVHGIVATGTMGEAGSLSSDERAAVVSTTVATVARRVPVYVGISAATPEQAARYARDAERAGAAGVMALPPLLYRGDRAEILAFFRALTTATELPLMIYNNPLASGTDMLPELLAEICREVGTVSAIKECSGDARRIAELLALCPDVEVLVGGDDWALEGFCAGSTGWISGIAVVLPGQCVRLWELCVGGDLAPARELYAELLPLARWDMTPKLVQYFKAALDELGLEGGPCRPPRLPLTEEELGLLRGTVARAGATRV